MPHSNLKGVGKYWNKVVFLSVAFFSLLSMPVSAQEMPPAPAVVTVRSSNLATSLSAMYSINDDKKIVAVRTAEAILCSGHQLIKLIGDGNPMTHEDETVYYCGFDGKKYTFPNRKTYLSWFKDFSSVAFVSPEDLASIPFGGNVTYKPGVRLVKTPSNPKTYVVGAAGVLHPIPDEATALKLFGADWNTQIDDVPPSFFGDYSISDLTPAVANDPSSQCSLTFSDFYLRQGVRAFAEVRGDMPGISWQKGPALVSDGKGGLSETINAGELRDGDFSMSYRGFGSVAEMSLTDDSDNSKWAQYGLDYLLRAMAPESRSFIQCVWWDPVQRKNISGAGVDCHIKVNITTGTNVNGGRTCTIEPRGNMANLIDN